MAAATLFGPVAAGAIVERWGWGVMTAAAGVFVASGTVPAVSFSFLGGGDLLIWGQFFYTGGWVFGKEDKK